MNLLEKLDRPKWLKSHEDCSYLTVMGSRAYRVANENSDYDFYGFTCPPIEVLFPYLTGEILGFGRQIQRFEQAQFDHKYYNEFISEYDLTIYNIIKYFQLVTLGNPNLLDSIFVPEDCIVHQDKIGRMVRNNRKLFLSEKCLHTYKGMLFSHLSRIKSGHIKEGRVERAKELNSDFDVKDGYHSVRMILELNQILYSGDLNFEEHNNILLEIRNGNWTKEFLVEYCEDYLNKFETDKDFVVPYEPNERMIKNLLVDCLEEKFGSLSKFGYNIL